MNVSLGVESSNIALHSIYFQVLLTLPGWSSQAEEILDSASPPKWIPPADFLESSSSQELSHRFLIGRHYHGASVNQQTSLKEEVLSGWNAWSETSLTTAIFQSALPVQQNRQTNLFVLILLIKISAIYNMWIKPYHFPTEYIICNLYLERYLSIVTFLTITKHRIRRYM